MSECARLRDTEPALPDGQVDIEMNGTSEVGGEIDDQSDAKLNDEVGGEVDG